MGYTLERQEPSAVFDLGCEIARRLKRNGVLRSDWARGRVVAAAERATQGEAHYTEPDGQQQLRLWHAPEVYWPVADRFLRVVKTVRRQTKNEATVLREGNQKRSRKQAVHEESTNFYATNLELGPIPPMFIHQLGRSRWAIDADVFQTLTTEDHLKKPSVRQNRPRALVVLTMIRVLAYTLALVFYHRQVRSHLRKASFGFCDLARRLAYLYLAPKLDSS